MKVVARKIVLVYVAVGALWILGSDRLLGALTRDPGTMVYVAIYKGWAFIAITGAMLYYLMLVGVERNEAAERARHESEARYRRIVETAEEGVWSIDARNNTTYVNGKMARMLGYTPEEMQGEPLFRFVQEGDRGVVLDHVGRQRRGIREHFDFDLVRKDRSTFSALLAVSPISDEAGEYAGALAMVTDITERKALHEQLHQMQKMEAIGCLAGGIAHDFNNLLTAVIGFTGLAQAQLSPTDPAYAYLEKVELAANRATGLTKQLLAFARKQVTETRRVNLNEVIRNAGEILRPLIGEHIEMQFSLVEDLGAIHIDPGQMEQVIVNMAVNARDAMPEGGRLTIETGNAVMSEGPPAADIAPGKYVLLTIRDSGVGMSEGVRSRIFEPFFTTKPPGMGTGLGLSTCFGIVRQCGGQIRVESEPGRGTCFRIFLPQADGRSEEIRAECVVRQHADGHETILLVEDEAFVREIAARALRERGYAVMEASNGREALRVMNGVMAPISLLITDWIMPEMGGRELSERLRERNPDLRILVTSGYADEILAAREAVPDNIDYLQKPFTAQELSGKVRAFLDAPQDVEAAKP